MKELRGKGILPGKASGLALVTRQPLNLTSGLSKPMNMFEKFGGVYYDRHHELYQRDLYNRILVFPQTIGSTFTGMVLLETIRRGRGPRAIVVATADTLLASGLILAEVCLEKKIPCLEIGDAQLFDLVKTGQAVEVDADRGVLKIVG